MTSLYTDTLPRESEGLAYKDNDNLRKGNSQYMSIV